MKESSRPYDSPRRREAAEATRDGIAAAARSLFAERGWAATTVRDIARLAHVSEPTIYNAFGGKEGLAIALVEELEADADVVQAREEILTAAGHPPAQLAALVGFDRRLFERGGDIMVLVREAGRTVPELADIYTESRHRGRGAQHVIFGAWPDGTLRADVDLDTACDIYAGISNVDTFRMLSDERGWSGDRIQEWWTSSLATLLLAAPQE
jgi:AcrR family transcriptional regulator